ncbi:MAG: FAD-binding oxidoreductase, partial [Mycobacterium sp.]|nr:FAD-binding oxidoreductase [Mycobacterium sp.]
MSLTDTLAGIVGDAHVITDPDVLDGRSVDHTGRYRGHASALVRPGSTDEVAAVLRACRDAGVYITVQGGRTSLVAGTVPEHDDVLLSTERVRNVGAVDHVERRIHVGAGATLADVQRAASAADLVFGVDLAAEGTLGVITGLDLRLHPRPTQRVTAICGFDDLDALVETGRAFRDMDGIAALELIDARASALTAEHVGVAAPVDGQWQLLIELAGDTDQTERLANALGDARMMGEPAVGVDVGAQQRLWQVRESVAEVL